MTIQQKLISIGGTLEQERIILKNIEIPFYIPSEELKEAFFDLLTGKFKRLSFDYKKLIEKHLQKLEIRKPKTKKLTDQLTQKQRDELNKHLDKKAFNLIIFSLSKKYELTEKKNKWYNLIFWRIFKIKVKNIRNIKNKSRYRKSGKILKSYSLFVFFSMI